ncbi:MAG: tyrosine--tRNA ligase [Chloroflexi bacterium]|nr:tyrosine--tRNA ligase [Chloroflexota bacterium]
MDDVLDLLYQRGFVQQVSDEEDLRRRLEGPITLYCGFDPTKPSLTIGNLMQLMLLGWFQRFGHRPIVLMGGGTTMIGDPTGKTESRPILGEEQIERNVQAVKGQSSRFFDFGEGRALLVNNAAWLRPLKFIDFMREIGNRFSVNEILRLEAYRTRLEAGGLTFLEFSYVLVQSYDFLHLYQTHDCILQVGGSDQWGNCVAGADLIRKVTGGQAFALVTPLILTSTGIKMGKTEAGSVWLDPRMTSPYDYYQYWRNTDDRDVERYLALYTFLPMEEVRALGRLEGVELNRAKEVLAFEATKIVHGEEEARRAREAAHALFAGSGAADAVPTVQIAAEQLARGIPVTDLFKEAGLVSSANEARSLISQGGLSINGRPVTDPRARIDLSGANDGHLMLSRGRKRHMRVVWE